MKNKRILLSVLLSSFCVNSVVLANRKIDDKNFTVNVENDKSKGKSDINVTKSQEVKNDKKEEFDDKKLMEKFDFWVDRLWKHQDNKEPWMLDSLDFRLRAYDVFSDVMFNMPSENFEESVRDGERIWEPWTSKHLNMGSSKKFQPLSVLSPDNITSEHITEEQFKKLFESGNGNDAFQCLSSLSPTVRNKILEMSFKSIFILASCFNIPKTGWNFKENDQFKYLKSIIDKKWE